MSYHQFTYLEQPQPQGPNKWVIGGVACATTILVAGATFALTANTDAAGSLYTAPATAIKVNTQVAARMPAMQAAAEQQPQAAFAQPAAEEEYYANVAPLNPLGAAPAPASGNNNVLLLASFSAMLLAVASALGAAFGYRAETIAMASGGGGPGTRSAKKGGKAAGGQAGVGYKGSTVGGSAPTTRSGKAGFVYKLGQKNGLGNVDEYSPIYNPVEWKSDGDTYEPGLLGIAVWAAGFLSLLGVSAFLIYYTSAL